MSVTRRQLLQLSVFASVAGSAWPVRANRHDDGDVTTLPVPPLLEARHGQPLFLTMQACQWSFNGRQTVPTAGLNGQYLGPTIRVHDQSYVKLIYSNRLSEPVAMTISGLQVAGALSGGGARIISPSIDWSPVLQISQPAATCWYHASTPGKMARQVYSGLAGMWIIDDEQSQTLPLPHHYGVDDFPLIIQDKRLDNFGHAIYQDDAEGFLGNTLLVNGVQSPTLNVARGFIRFRLVNASSRRYYQLTTSDHRPFIVIAGDQGFLPSPVPTTTLGIAPGERREVLIDLSDGKPLFISAGESADLAERIRGIFGSSTVLTSTRVVTLNPTGLIPLVTDSLLKHLVPAITAGQAVRSRLIKLGNAATGINGQHWQAERIDITAQQASFEQWIIETEQPQPFFITGAKFLVKAVNGAPPLMEDRGWKDCVWVDGRVELLVNFPNTASAHFPLSYGSQNLDLADSGVIGQLSVQPSVNVG